MIQSVILTAAATLAAPSDALLQVGRDTAEGADFGALLAQSADAANPGELPLGGPAAVSTPPPKLPPALPVAATTGSILPLALPIGVTEPAALLAVLTTTLDSDTPVQVSVPAGSAIKLDKTPECADPATPASLSLVAKRPTAELSEPRKHASKPELSQATAQLIETPADERSPKLEPTAALEPVAFAAATIAPNAPIVAVPSQPADAPTPRTPEPSRAAPTTPRSNSAKPLPEPSLTNPKPEPARQAFAHASPQAAFLRAVAGPVPQPEQPAETQPSAPRVPASLRVEIASPVQAALEAKFAEKIATPLRSRADAAVEWLTTAIPAAIPTPVPPTALVTPALVASLRPLDFTALVDRLVAAREAVQPPGALLTVAHADFGPVELRFHHDERGLAVSLASADPDFARVAAAATPPQLPPSTAQFSSAEPGQPSPRSDSQSATNGSATSNSRGQQSDRRGDAPPQSNHHPRSAAQGAAARRSGIFA